MTSANQTSWRALLFGVIAMAIIVLVSNIGVQYIIADGWLTYGAFSYPLAFLVTDIMNRTYGTSTARKVIFAGFVTGVICSLIGSQIHGEFGPLVTLRIAIGSGTAFLVAQLLDVLIFSWLKGRVWWQAPLVSTLIGSTVDTAIFFTIAFSAGFDFLEPANDVSWANELAPLFGIGPELAYWQGLAIADWMVKLSIALAALVPFKLIITRLSPSPA